MPTALAPFGSTPQPAIHEPDEEGERCFLVTTDDAGPYVVSSGDVPQVYRPDGTPVVEERPALMRSFHVYELEAGTTYRVLSEASGTTFAVYDVLAGGGCPVLPDVSWAASADPTDLTGGVVACRTVNAPAGAILRLGGTSEDEQIVIDGDGEWLCTGQGPSTTTWCRLDQGPGPYKFIAAATTTQPRGPTDMSVVDIASTDGCDRISPIEWSAGLPAYQRDVNRRWQCFAFTPDATAGHLIRTTSERQWATFELWQVGEGRVERNTTSEEATSFLLQDFERGADYRFILRGTPPSWDPGYRFGIFDLRRDLGCRSDVHTQWGAPATHRSVAFGGFDCYLFGAQEPEKFRLQVETGTGGGRALGLLTNAAGDRLCLTHGPRAVHDLIGVCRVEGPGPYRLIVGPDMERDRTDRDQGYAVNLTEADSEGCPRIELAAWDRPLPLIDHGDGAPYHCFALTTGRSSYHRLSAWLGEGSVSRKFELWEAGTNPQTGPKSGLPEARQDLYLVPHAEYRLVTTAGMAGEGPGEYRAGLFDVGGSGGCPQVEDLGWSAPPVTGEVSKGELDCREIPGQVGDLRRLAEFGTTVFAASGWSCHGGQGICELAGTGPWRAITEAGVEEGEYLYWVNDPTDHSGCPQRPGAARPENEPFSAQFGPGERRCFVVEVPAGGVYTRTASTPSDPREDPPFLISPHGDFCSLGDWFERCVSEVGPQVLVLGNERGPVEQVDVLFRDPAAYPSDCRPLTSTSITGTLSGRFDEACFSFSAPAGLMFTVDVRDPQGRSQPTGAIVAPDGAVCDGPAYSPAVWTCRASGGPVALSVINAAAATGSFKVDIARVRAGFLVVPQVVGRPAVGSTLRLRGGVREPQSSSLSVRWLRGEKVVGSGLSYRVRRADMGHRLRARLTVRSPGYADGVYVVRGPRIPRR